MKDYTASLLGLKDVIVKNVVEDDASLLIDIELPRAIHHCPDCGAETDKIHDYRSQLIKDSPAHGKHVYLRLRKRRYVCTCGKRFYEQNSIVPRYHRATSRNIAQIITEFRELVPASAIAKRHNLSASTVFRYFDLVSYPCRELPEVLSIDEFKGNADGEKYQTILTDAKNRRIVDILPDRKNRTLIDYFMRFSNRKDVKYVVMDMNSHFREVAKRCFPKAKIVVDRFHLVRQAMWALERVRKEEQKRLSPEWRRYCKHSRYLLNKAPEKLKPEQKEQLRIILGLSTRLERAYDLKNDFLSLMHAPNSEIAAKRLGEWVMHVECSNLPEFGDCTKAIHNWDTYILNSFDCSYTNGYTEGCNNKTKVLKRVCFGIRKFSRFRSRILHCAA